MQTLYELGQTEGNDLARNMKKCPFCAEAIQYEAIKCRWCNEFLNGQRPITTPAAPAPGKKLHQSTGAIILALATVGPLALPLVWTHPRYNRVMKIAITVGVLSITAAACTAIYRVVVQMLTQIKSLGL